MYHVVEQKVKCSKCGSMDIVKPANENLVWFFKCQACGHTKDYEPPVTKISMGWVSSKDYKDTIEF